MSINAQGNLNCSGPTLLFRRIATVDATSAVTSNGVAITSELE